MVKPIHAIRGMNDILPSDIAPWQLLESHLRELCVQYDYHEIRFPIVEKTDLFKRSIGDVTDIVEKEMYVFDDRNGDSLALRPEGTACCVRAGIEQGILHNQSQRLWYIGPMFRHERPQKGRYRQFYQFGLEAIGLEGPGVDAEIIAFSARLWQRLGLDKHVVLQINSLGTLASRAAYRTALVDYFQSHKNNLDEDSVRRLETNPLRILDSKNPAMAEINAGAPKLLDYLDEESKTHFNGLLKILDEMGVVYEINPRLVRGLDYYTKTVFEWVTDELGAQGTICAGGRYDGLVEQLGGKPSPAVGFSMGLERIVLMMQALQQTIKAQTPDCYFLAVGEQAQAKALILAEKLRTGIPALSLSVNCSGGSFKSQIKKADKSGAQFALILGDDELANQTVTLKQLRCHAGDQAAQQQINTDELVASISALMTQST